MASLSSSSAATAAAQSRGAIASLFSMTFAGNVLDKLDGVTRKDEAKMEALRCDPNALYLPLFKLQPLVAVKSLLAPPSTELPPANQTNTMSRLGFHRSPAYDSSLSPDSFIPWIRLGDVRNLLEASSPLAAALNSSITSGSAILLGVHQGVPHLAFSVDSADSVVHSLSIPDKHKDCSLQFFEMRRFMGLLSMIDASLAGQAMSLMQWHQNNKFCSRCGSSTKPTEGGNKRKCVGDASQGAALSDKPKSGQLCGSSFYPRVDPVVIMTVSDPSDTRLLLGRKAMFPKNLYTCMAGFMAPGETIEEAVAREAHEESGVRVGSVEYLASQPWPYGGQIMIGCHSRAVSESISLHDQELEEARWFSIAELEKMVESSKVPNSFLAVTDLRLPPPTALAHVLVASWLQYHLLHNPVKKTGPS